jgi:Fe-S cluster biogenesis protein NfuA
MMDTEVIKEADLNHRIEEALNGIRPYMEADGGNVRVLGFTSDQTLKLEFVGACGTCPMSTMTFKAGVEEAIKRVAPEIKRIEVVNLTTA